MKNFTTELMITLAREGDVKEFFRHSLEEAINHLLEHELSVYLDYEKGDVEHKETEDKRNGYYERTLKSEYGPLHLRIPRDRLGEFLQHTVPRRKQSTDGLEATILTLYRRGITTREIATLIEKMYGNHYSAASVSQLSKVIDEDVKTFHQRQVNAEYVVIYCDATFIPLRRDTVSKECVYVLSGITAEGHKEVLDFMICPGESATMYKQMLSSLKERGLKKVLLFVSDGLTGLADALRSVFPTAQHQNCWTHLIRNAELHVRAKDKQQIASELRAVREAESAEEANEQMDAFCKKWEKDYPSLKRLFRRRDNLFSYLKFPREIQKYLYTNNLAESLNKMLKRTTKVKEQFPNVDSLDRWVCTVFLKYNAEGTSRIQQGFRKVSYEITQKFLAI